MSHSDEEIEHEPVRARRPHGFLQALLDAAGQARDEPELQLRPVAGAPYGPVDEVLVMTRRAHLTRLGFVGNEAYGQF